MKTLLLLLGTMAQADESANAIMKAIGEEMKNEVQVLMRTDKAAKKMRLGKKNGEKFQGKEFGVTLDSSSAGHLADNVEAAFTPNRLIAISEQIVARNKESASIAETIMSTQLTIDQHSGQGHYQLLSKSGNVIRQFPIQFAAFRTVGVGNRESEQSHPSLGAGATAALKANRGLRGQARRAGSAKTRATATP